MIKWYGDEEIGIFFDILPRVGVRYFLPTMTKTERESVERYPFINKKELKVALLDRKKSKKYTKMNGHKKWRVFPSFFYEKII